MPPLEDDVVGTVVIGDSIASGHGTPDGRGWPDLLVGVVNDAVAGRRLLAWSDCGIGPSGEERFHALVTGRQVDTVIVAVGLNDLWSSVNPECFPPGVDATGLEVTDRLAALGWFAGHQGTRYVLATLPPSAGFATPLEEEERQVVNRWIRSSGHLVVDVDLVLEDPVRPGWPLPEFDAGDHVHVTPAGQRAIADEAQLVLGLGPPTTH